MLCCRSSTADDTRTFGEKLGALLRDGDVVLLQGPLGAGKTAMTQGIGRGAGSASLINSPTFVLMNEYKGAVKIYHVDLYRLETAEEIMGLDLPGYTVDGALVVEWPERGHGLLPEEHLHVAIDYDGENGRRFTLTAFGARPAELLRSLSGHVSGVAAAHG